MTTRSMKRSGETTAEQDNKVGAANISSILKLSIDRGLVGSYTAYWSRSLSIAAAQNEQRWRGAQEEQKEQVASGHKSNYEK